jgi:hypothetical protein
MIAVLITFIWAVLCLMYDALSTQKGLKAGVAVEGNPLIVAAYGNKPKLWQCLSIDGTIRVAMLLAALMLPAPADYPHSWHALFAGGFVVYGLKNIQGGRQWNWMLKNPGKKIPQLNSAWSQFVGFWG